MNLEILDCKSIIEFGEKKSLEKIKNKLLWTFITFN